MDLSVVIPVFNERDNIGPLYARLHEVLERHGRSYECVFVDDGSRDGTFDELQAIQRRDAHVRVVRFRKNFGQTPAMRVGIRQARGRTIVTMDGDLQNDARDIEQLVCKIDEGYDLAIGWRRDRQDPLWSRTLPSKIANWLIGRITGVPIHDSGCSLKAYRGDMIKRVPLYSEMHRFIPAMSTTTGARITEVVVRHHPRRSGKSKYGISRVGKVLLDVIAIKMLISFKQHPLRWFFFLAVPLVLLAAVAAAFCTVHWAFGPPGQTSVVPSIALLLLTYLMAHFLFLGLLSELIVRSGRTRGTIPSASARNANASAKSFDL